MVGRSAGINTDTAMTCAFQRKRECECDSDSDSDWGWGWDGDCDCDWDWDWDSDWERGLPVRVVRSELPPPMLAPAPPSSLRELPVEVAVPRLQLVRARKAKIIMPNNFRRFLLAAVDDGVLALTLKCGVYVCVCVCVARIMIYTELSRR